jgi:expansin (peptidoglycan-binding protein)
MRAKRPGGRLRLRVLPPALAVAGAVVALCALGYSLVFGGSDGALWVSVGTSPSPDRPTSLPVPTVSPSAGPESAKPTGEPVKSVTRAAATAKPTADRTPKKTKRRTTTPATTGAGSAAPLAGKIKPGVTRKGVATFYQGAQNTGACLFDRSPDHLTAAMNWSDYEGSNACGAYVKVRGSNGATITVRITNLCPAPCRVGQLDLDPEAYKALAPLPTGETPITWTLASPKISGGIAIRYKDGSSQWWCGIQVINHRNPVARLEVKVAGAWKSLPRTEYNYFLSEKGAGCGGAIRVTDIYGQKLVVSAKPVTPEVTQKTSQQFARH